MPEILCGAQLQVDLGPSHQPQAPFIRLSGACSLGTGYNGLSKTSCPSPPALSPNTGSLGTHATSRDPGPRTRSGGSGCELSMVAPRLGTQSRRLPAPRRARDPSPDRWNGETRSQAHHLRGWGCSQALAHTSKDYFVKRVLTCGQRWLRGARLRTSNPAAGGAPGTAVVVFDPWGTAAVAES